MEMLNYHPNTIARYLIPELKKEKNPFHLKHFLHCAVYTDRNLKKHIIFSPNHK